MADKGKVVFHKDGTYSREKELPRVDVEAQLSGEQNMERGEVDVMEKKVASSRGAKVQKDKPVRFDLGEFRKKASKAETEVEVTPAPVEEKKDVVEVAQVTTEIPIIKEEKTVVISQPIEEISASPEVTAEVQEEEKAEDGTPMETEESVVEEELGFGELDVSEQSESEEGEANALKESEMGPIEPVSLADALVEEQPAEGGAPSYVEKEDVVQATEPASGAQFTVVSVAELATLAETSPAALEVWTGKCFAQQAVYPAFRFVSGAHPNLYMHKISVSPSLGRFMALVGVGRNITALTQETRGRYRDVSAYISAVGDQITDKSSGQCVMAQGDLLKETKTI